jgi:hypothetical protein
MAAAALIPFPTNLPALTNVKNPMPLDPRGRPEPYKAPDRVAWEKKWGVAPFVAKPTAEKDANWLAMRAKEAREYIQRDWSTLAAEETHGHHADLDFIHDAVASMLGTDDLVFFDPDDGQFWVYPEKP